MNIRPLILMWFLFLPIEKPVAQEPAETDWQAMQEEMIRKIQQDVRMSRDYTGRGSLKPDVLAAVAAVERHQFVPSRYQSQAYENHPLPIGLGQTISQPFIVALMTDLLEVGEGDRVLEVGTGSGYQAAVLAEMVESVYSIEIVPDLAREAKQRLGQLGYLNVHVQAGDGTLGWPDHAPFDGIIVTAAGIEIPQLLIDQLKPGGKLVIPVGAEFQTQQLMVITRNPDGSTQREEVLPVRFVPITH